MKKSVKSLWFWLISFLPYRRVKFNSVIGEELKRDLEPISFMVLNKNNKQRRRRFRI